MQIFLDYSYMTTDSSLIYSSFLQKAVTFSNKNKIIYPMNYIQNISEFYLFASRAKTNTDLLN